MRSNSNQRKLIPAIEITKQLTITIASMTAIKSVTSTTYALCTSNDSFSLVFNNGSAKLMEFESEKSDKSSLELTTLSMTKSSNNITANVREKMKRIRVI